MDERIADRSFRCAAERRLRDEQRVTFTPSALSEVALHDLLSSTVTSTRSTSDFVQNVSWERLPQSSAARIARSCLISSTRPSSA
jgi:hypothetical protein